jgi:hypothetical protein
MTKHEITGLLAFHDLIRCLAHLDLMHDKEVIHLKKLLNEEPLPPKVMMALFQIINDIQDHGL